MWRYKDIEYGFLNPKDLRVEVCIDQENDELSNQRPLFDENKESGSFFGWIFSYIAVIVNFFRQIPYDSNKENDSTTDPLIGEDDKEQGESCCSWLTSIICWYDEEMDYGVPNYDLLDDDEKFLAKMRSVGFL
ncbi:hypothetical protein WR25_19389 [Diploscapter pachys]|uniref:Uncharacterized protein n=1 Tax=Diploscapter pachys TaxID=2018661 RepID=A0A2A2K975_9BILA|nr:hypothetical protein WR25_19389 [Diploscapter pachys]